MVSGTISDQKSKVVSEELTKISQSIHNLSPEEVEAALAMLYAAKEEALAKPIDKRVEDEAQVAWESFRKVLERKHQSKLHQEKENLNLKITIEVIAEKYLDSEIADKVTPVLTKCAKSGDFAETKKIYEKMEPSEERDLIRFFIHSVKWKSWDVVGGYNPQGIGNLERTIKDILGNATPRVTALNQDLISLGIIRDFS